MRLPFLACISTLALIACGPPSPTVIDGGGLDSPGALPDSAVLPDLTTIAQPVGTWTRATAPADLPELLAVGGSSGLGLVAVGKMGALLRSTDKGATWTAGTSNTTEELHAVVAGTDRLLVAGSGAVLVSSDGTTWTPSDTGQSTGFWNGAFASGSTCYLAGVDLGQPNGSALMVKSTSNGASSSWTKVTLPISANLTLIAMSGTSASDVWVVGYDFTGMKTHLLHTSDGGTTWSTGTRDMPAFTFTGVWAAGASDAFVGASSDILRTSDGTTFTSATWEPATGLTGPVTSAHVFGVSGSSTVFATLGDAIIRSQGGNRWEKENGPTLANGLTFSGANGFALDASTVVVVGSTVDTAGTYKGAILRRGN